METPNREEIVAYFQALQDSICHALASADGKGSFVEDHWERPGGGGGRSRIIQDGAVIEKGGVGFSAVWGQTHEAMLASLGIQEKANFFATGVSVVIHPRNPMMPIIHKNIRYFELDNGICWFGGGIDLTPHYVVPTDAHWFHKQLKNVCDAHKTVADYAKFKTWADDYFFIKHRNETRGIGGIFFDHLKPSTQQSKAEIFAFVKAVGESFAPIYTTFMQEKALLPYSENEKNWQALRRGRYVEFNLVWDRGTKFGLDTNGRTESILMSMPPQASWMYNFQPQLNSPEIQTLEWLRKGVDWVGGMF